MQVVEQQQQQQLMMVTLSRPIITAQSADAMQGVCGMLPIARGILLRHARLGCCMASAFRAQSDGNVTAIWFNFDGKGQGVEETQRD